MQAKDLLIDPCREWTGASDSWQPLGFVDLDACPHDVTLGALPPFPLVGLGDPAHPLVSSLDAIVESTFSVGGDLEEFGTTRDPATAHLIRSRTLPALALAGRAGILDVHVQGGCVGSGLEIAAFAGRLTATPDAWFQLPELTMGLIPGAGGCVSVPGRIGRQRAGLMILSSRRINAATALRLDRRDRGSAALCWRLKVHVDIDVGVSLVHHDFPTHDLERSCRSS